MPEQAAHQAQQGLVFLRPSDSQLRQHLRIDIVLLQITQRLYDQAADPPGRGHVARCRVLERDRLIADLYGARSTIRQECQLHRHLLGQAKQVGSISPRWLQTQVAFACQRKGNLVCRRQQRPQKRVGARNVIQAARYAS